MSVSAARKRRKAIARISRLFVLAMLGAATVDSFAYGQDQPVEPTQVAPRATQTIDDERPTRPRRTPDPEPTPRSASYGGQIVLADLCGLLLGAVATAAVANGIPLVAGWILPSPIIHVAHDHPGAAGVSLLLHVGLPVLGAAGGALLPCSNKGDSEIPCGLVGVIMGGGLGMIGATLIDAAFLAQYPDSSRNHAALEDGIAKFPALSIGPRGRLSLDWRGRF